MSKDKLQLKYRPYTNSHLGVNIFKLQTDTSVANANTESFFLRVSIKARTFTFAALGSGRLLQRCGDEQHQSMAGAPLTKGGYYPRSAADRLKAPLMARDHAVIYNLYI